MSSDESLYSDYIADIYFEENVVSREKEKNHEGNGILTMSGFSYHDKVGSKLLTVSVVLDSMYPPKFNFNVATLVNGKVDRQNNKSWAPLNLSAVSTLIANLTDPSTYGPVSEDNKLKPCIGLSNDGSSFVVGIENKYQTLNLSEDAKKNLLHYLQMWLQFGTVFKDLYDNITDKIAKDVENLLKDFARQQGYNIERLSRFDKDENNSYINKKNSGGGNYPNYNAAPPAPSKPTPPPHQNIPKMPVPGMPIPPNMNMENPVMPGAPVGTYTPPQMPTGSAPQYQVPQTPKMPNMGMSIPQTPNGPNGEEDFGNAFADMVKQWGS